MSRFQHLPLFQKCYGFVKEVYKLKLLLPKNLKHELGSDLLRSALQCTKLVILANGSENKERALKELFLEERATTKLQKTAIETKPMFGRDIGEYKKTYH